MEAHAPLASRHSVLPLCGRTAEHCLGAVACAFCGNWKGRLTHPAHTPFANPPPLPPPPPLERSGKQAHGVLESMAAPQQQQQQRHQQQQGCGHQGRPVERRVTFLVNWWAQQPQGIKRATQEDVREGKLAPAADGLRCGPHLSTVDSSSHSSSCNAAAGDPSLASLLLEDAPQSPAAGAGSRQEAALGAVEFVRIEAPALAPGSVLPVS